MIVHIGTQVTVRFGRLDENGNVVNHTPVTLTLDTLEMREWVLLHRQVMEQREKLQEGLQGLLEREALIERGRAAAEVKPEEEQAEAVEPAVVEPKKVRRKNNR